MIHDILMVDTEHPHISLHALNYSKVLYPFATINEKHHHKEIEKDLSNLRLLNNQFSPVMACGPANRINENEIVSSRSFYIMVTSAWYTRFV